MSAHRNSETNLIPDSSLRAIRGSLIDMSQITAHESHGDRIVLIFRNGDKLEFTWRDELERNFLLGEFGLSSRNSTVGTG